MRDLVADWLEAAGYARSSGGMPDSRMSELLGRVDAAMLAGTYMFILPQFSITARKPG